jgi:hypothetical protein
MIKELEVFRGFNGAYILNPGFDTCAVTYVRLRIPIKTASCSEQTSTKSERDDGGFLLSLKNM